MRKRLVFGCLVACCLLLTACFENQQTIETNKKTILMYMVANNNLESSAYLNIEDILCYSDRSLMSNGQLLIYLVSSKRPPTLYELKPSDNSQRWRSDTVAIKRYDHPNSLDPEAMRTVLRDAFKHAPAEEYDLILWSHSTAWIPKEIVNLQEAHTSMGFRFEQQRIEAEQEVPPILTKSFGVDGNNRMDVSELASALEGFDLGFILIDACFGASLEFVYELKDCARYIVGSPTEILEYGFPYKNIIGTLFDKNLKMEEVCKNLCKAYMQFYREELSVNGITYPYASISLINLSQIDSLMVLLKEISDRNTNQVVSEIDFSQVQSYDNRSHSIFYDFRNFIEMIQDPDQILRTTIIAQLFNTIPYCDYTPYFYSCLAGYGKPVPMNECCGLSCYIVRDEAFNDDVIEAVNKAFYETKMAKDLELTHSFVSSYIQ